VHRGPIGGHTADPEAAEGLEQRVDLPIRLGVERGHHGLVCRAIPVLAHQHAQYVSRADLEQGSTGLERETPHPVREAHRLPELPDPIDVAWRTGVDLHPVDITDDDQVRWLRALIFPEHVERHAQLAAAIRIARAHPLHLIEGDAVERLPELLEQAPRDSALVVFATITLYQFPRDSVRSFFKLLVRHGEKRPVFFISMEGTGGGRAELLLSHYVGGERDTRKLADCNPHGHWIEWVES